MSMKKNVLYSVLYFASPLIVILITYVSAIIEQETSVLNLPAELKIVWVFISVAVCTIYIIVLFIIQQYAKTKKQTIIIVNIISLAVQILLLLSCFFGPVIIFWVHLHYFGAACSIFIVYHAYALGNEILRKN